MNGGATIVNDRFMVITYGDIMDQVHKRVSREIANAISAYVVACVNYPDASIFDPTETKADGDYTGDPGIPDDDVKGHIPVDSANWAGCGNALPVWVENEDWHKVTYYQFSETLPCPNVDCLTVNNSGIAANSIEALIVFAGRELLAPVQVRGDVASDMADYFENENNNGDITYDAAETEDYVHVIAP
jgi:hypothetical protein